MNRDRDYTYRSMRDEREYGLYWYSGLWHVLRPLLVGLAVFVMVAGIGITVWNRLYGSFFAPVDAGDETEYAFEISSGQSLSRVANNLESAGLIRSHTVFKYYCDFAGMGQKIQVGTYGLKKNMPMTEIAEKLTMGDGNPLVRNITLIPGESVEDFAARLVRTEVLKSSDTFLQLCRSGEAFRDYYYIDDVFASGTAGKRKYVLEGYLAPNTYEFYVTATEEEIIRRMLSQTEAAFPAELQELATEQGMTMDQVLTLASMIEKEAKEADFLKVSAVFHNRLAAGMKLESDVTVHYVTGVRRMALEDRDLAVSSPYNTYQVTGLPVGPICNPSQKAIEAALNPDASMVAEKYLYFCAKEPESGELYFSRTLEEHDRAVKQYLPAWQKYDADRGIQ
ncbi:MAG: endolytic transglycosylase MltG [Clostridiales bacterium]|nr:endolytic transglycosylase MltG [Clostridiales bacterium]